MHAYANVGFEFSTLPQSLSTALVMLLGIEYLEKSIPSQLVSAARKNTFGPLSLPIRRPPGALRPTTIEPRSRTVSPGGSVSTGCFGPSITTLSITVQGPPGAHVAESRS